MELFLTVDQAAQRLQVHVETVRRQIKRGELQAVRRGRTLRIPESALGAVPVRSVGAPKTAATVRAHASRLWEEMTSGEPARHNAAIVALSKAPAKVRAIIRRQSAAAAAAYYSTPEGRAELADWRALDGEPFKDGEDGFPSAGRGE